jgi:hypothetical protein
MLFVEDDTMPLFASLYSGGTPRDKIRSDNRSLFPSAQNGTPEDLSNFETEILYHYAVSEEVQWSIDNFISGQREVEPGEVIRCALSQQDLSIRLQWKLVQ